MPNFETKSRLRHREPGEGMFNPNVINADHPGPWDEPVTRDIPRQQDRELVTGICRDTGDTIHPSAHRMIKRARDDGDAAEIAANADAALCVKQKRPIHSDRGEKWTTINAVVSYPRTESVRSGDAVSYSYERVRRHLVNGWPIAGRKLAFKPFPGFDAPQQEVA